VDEEFYAKITPAKVGKIEQSYRTQEEGAEK
jgi:hypothetical protein